MFCRDVRLSRLREKRVAHLYSKSLLSRILFVVSKKSGISGIVLGGIRLLS